MVAVRVVPLLYQSDSTIVSLRDYHHRIAAFDERILSYGAVPQDDLIQDNAKRTGGEERAPLESASRRIFRRHPSLFDRGRTGEDRLVSFEPQGGLPDKL